MSASRLLRLSRPLGHGFCNEGLLKSKTVMCLSKSGQSSEHLPGLIRVEKKPVPVKAVGYASVVISEPKTDREVDLGLILEYVKSLMSKWVKLVLLVRKQRERLLRLNMQLLIEKVIVDCRFFTLMAIAGSLLGSILCFVEGCLLMLNSYFQFFHALSQSSDKGHVMFLLLESIDMFLVGTAMLIFGMSLHVMFVGSEHRKSSSSSSINFSIQKLQKWMGIESVMQAKSKMGHAVILILQVEVLEKCKSIPMTTGLDLACFAGVVLLSSAAVFVLSKIALNRAEAKQSILKL